MTRPGIEPRSPGPLANTLTTRLMSGIKCKPPQTGAELGLPIPFPLMAAIMPRSHKNFSFYIYYFLLLLPPPLSPPSLHFEDEFLYLLLSSSSPSSFSSSPSVLRWVSVFIIFLFSSSFNSSFFSSVLRWMSIFINFLFTSPPPPFS